MNDYYQRSALDRVSILKQGAAKMRQLRCDGTIMVQGVQKRCDRILLETQRTEPLGDVVQCSRCGKRHVI